MNRIILENIYSELLEISDKNTQEELWLGKNPNKSSSFTEVMCRLFDDNDFTHFVNTDAMDMGFSLDTLESLKKLHFYLDKYEELDNDIEIINDQNWSFIRQIALDVIHLWKQDELNLNIKD